MELASLGDLDLEFEVLGTGEPVLFIHGSCIPDAFATLVRQPALAHRYRPLRYRRRGYGASSRVAETLSMADQAADVAALLDYLGIRCAHVVGHSLGGAIALQLALSRPALVHSLALLEPVLLAVPGAEVLVSASVQAIDLYLGGDKDAAVEVVLEMLGGDDWKLRLESGLPGATNQAFADADAFFLAEVLGAGSWAFTREHAEVLPHPMLTVVGERSNQFFRRCCELLGEWVPHAEDAELFNATHLLQIDEPAAMAAVLGSFFARHPMETRP